MENFPPDKLTQTDSERLFVCVCVCTCSMWRACQCAIWWAAREFWILNAFVINYTLFFKSTEVLLLSYAAFLLTFVNRATGCCNPSSCGPFLKRIHCETQRENSLCYARNASQRWKWHNLVKAHLRLYFLSSETVTVPHQTIIIVGSETWQTTVLLVFCDFTRWSGSRCPGARLPLYHLTPATTNLYNHGLMNETEPETIHCRSAVKA